MNKIRLAGIAYESLVNGPCNEKGVFFSRMQAQLFGVF